MMNDTLATSLRRLRLSGLAQSLDVRLQEAAGNGLNHVEFLELFLQDELAIRAKTMDDDEPKISGVTTRCSRLAVHPGFHEPSPHQPATCPQRDHRWNAPKQRPFSLDNGEYRKANRENAPHDPTPSKQTESNPGDVGCRRDGFSQSCSHPVPLEVEPVVSGYSGREVPNGKRENQNQQRPEVPDARYDLPAGRTNQSEPVTES